MLLTVVTSEQSSALAHGLTYRSKDEVEAGSLVLVPLRNRQVEGIVIGVSEETATLPMKIKRVSGSAQRE
jgi:primosomal protein N'